MEFSSLDLDPKAFREVMFEAFPKLHHGGGYRFCKCKSNSRDLEPLSKHVLSSPRLLKE